MTDSMHARTPSAAVHALSGSSAGAGRPFAPLATVHEMPDTFVPLGSAAADVVAGLAARRAATAHPDAAVIALAGRLSALVPREDRVLGRAVAIGSRLDRWDLDNRPQAPTPRPSRMVGTDLSTATHRVTQFSEPLGADEEQEQQDQAYVAACRAHGQRKRRKVAASRQPYLQKLADRMRTRMHGWAIRLAEMEPLTHTGHAAKAAAALALNTTCSDGDWAQKLMASVSCDASRDALRITTALADVPPPERQRFSDPDPIIAMHRKATDLFTYAELEATPNDEVVASLDQMNALILAGPVFPPSTPAGALASLEWARHQLIQMMEQRDADTPYDKAIVSLLDGALAVFHRAFAAESAEPTLTPSATGEAAFIEASVQKLNDRGICTPAEAAVLDFKPWPDPCPLPPDSEMARMLGPHIETVRMGWSACNKSKSDLVAGLEELVSEGSEAVIGELMRRLSETTAMLEDLRQATYTAHLRLFVGCSILSLDPKYAHIDTGPLLSEAVLGEHSGRQAA